MAGRREGVLSVEEWIQIRELARKGLSVSEIARQSGRDRKTVRRVLIEERPHLHRPVAKTKGSKLDPFREYVLGRIAEGCLNGSVLFDEIRRQGYTGKLSILRDLLGPIRRELVRKREATERFETGPGKQAQVDWAEFGRIWVPDDGHWRKLYMFLFTLGYSRAQYLAFTTSCDMEHFEHCHIGAFSELGIPEDVLYDNLKTGILGRREDGTPILPGRFADFALYYGFTPKFCQPYRARTKGKVERGVGYVRQNFWVRVAAEVEAKLLFLPELNDRAREWAANVANVRVHGTHGEVVWQRYAEEAPLLSRTTGRPLFDTSYRALRRVGRDGRLSYRGRLYQVGLRHALSEVEVAEGLEGELRISSRSGERVRFEVVSPGGVVRGIVADFRSRVSKEESAAELLGLVGQSPQVERRDLSVYEEVVCAVSSD
jgi:transposase